MDSVLWTGGGKKDSPVAISGCHQFLSPNHHVQPPLSTVILLHLYCCFLLADADIAASMTQSRGRSLFSSYHSAEAKAVSAASFTLQLGLKMDVLDGGVGARDDR